MVDVEIPVTPNAEVFHASNPDRPDVVEVPLSVLYQVCSETICYTPRTETISLTAPFPASTEPGRPKRGLEREAAAGLLRRGLGRLAEESRRGWRRTGTEG